MKAITILSACFVLSSFYKNNDRIRLVFEEEKGIRSSFCMYNDGKFYEARPSGCVGQEFSWGYWEKSNDTVKLNYQHGKIFDFEVIQSKDSSAKYQFVRIIDCYNQPVRFQGIYVDTTWEMLYNPGIITIEKGKSLFYIAARFEDINTNVEPVFSNADTITYRWYCNRESIESISLGTLYYTYNEAVTKKALLRNKRVIVVE
jgi:hypothetical protein